MSALCHWCGLAGHLGIDCNMRELARAAPAFVPRVFAANGRIYNTHPDGSISEVASASVTFRKKDR